jgi:hypothetical protein
MSQVYLSDLRDSMREDIMRTIKRERPELYKLIQIGDAEGDTVEIAIGEYYRTEQDYGVV